MIYTISTLRRSHSKDLRACFLTSWKEAEVEMNSTRVCSGVKEPLPQKISPVNPDRIKFSINKSMRIKNST